MMMRKKKLKMNKIAMKFAVHDDSVEHWLDEQNYEFDWMMMMMMMMAMKQTKKMKKKTDWMMRWQKCLGEVYFPDQSSFAFVLD
jgi:hypothetical protein